MTTGTIPTVPATQTPQTQIPPKTAWAAIAAMMATSFVLVLAEFLPPSLLPSMAASLGITEGQAGQTVTVTAFIGFLTAPTIGILVPRLDRRTLLVILAGAAALSSAIVAVAPGFVLLLIARLLLGAALGAFWAMSIAIAASLSEPRHLGRAIMLVNTLRVPGIRFGLTGHILTVLGHFVAFTYIRLAIDRVPGLDSVGVAVLLVAFGIGGVVGNFLVGLLVDRHLAVLRFAVPLLIGVSIGIVALAPGQLWLVAVAVTTWGIGFGGWLTTLGTWMGRLVPDRMESGGGLSVAGFQLAITLGAGVGGLLIDLIGVTPALVVASASAIVGGLIFGRAVSPAGVPARTSQRSRAPTAFLHRGRHQPPEASARSRPRP